MTARLPPRSAVVMAADAGYAPWACLLAATIAEHHPQGGFDILLAAAAPLDLPASLPAPPALLPVPASHAFAGVQSGRHGGVTWFRLLLPGLLKGRYDRLLYLDADILCCGPGLDRLLAADLRGAPFAAVRDNQQWRSPRRRVAEFRAAGRPAAPYCNAGVLLIDISAWEAAGLTARAEELVRRRPDLMPRNDQSALNLAAEGRWAELSPVWNWQYTRDTRFHADLVEPRLIHFIGPVKPWSDRGAVLPPRFRRLCAAFAAAHWPDLPGLAPVDPEAPARPARLAAAFRRHWWSAGRMAAYLGRFPDPFAALPPG